MIRFALLVSLLLLACSQGPKDAAPRSMAPSKLGVRQVPLSILVAEDYGGSRFKIDAGTVDAGPTANEFRLALNIPSVLRNRNGNGVHLWVMGSNEKVDVLAQPLPTDFVVYTPWFSGRTASIVFETDPGINLTELELPIRVTGVEFHEEASGNDPVQLQPGRAMHGWIGQGMRARKYKLPLGMSTLYVDMLQCGCAEPRLTLSERGPAGQQTTILEPAAGDHNVLKVVNATADSTLTVEYGVGHGCYTIVAAPLRYAFSLTTDISALAWDQPIIQQETGELFAHTAAKLLTATDGRALLTGGEFGSMIPGLILGGFIFTFPALLPDLILRTGSNTSHAAPLLGIALYEKESVERRSQTLVHEMGHYFWLMLNEKSCPISLMADSSRSEFCALPDHVSNPSVPPAGQWAWLAAHFGEPGKQLWSASLVKYQSIEHALLATLSFVGCPSCSSATVRAVDFPKAVDVNHNGINDCREADSDGDGVIDDLDCAPADPSTRLDTDADGDGAPACGLKCGDGSCSVACEGNLCPVGCPEGHEYCPPPCTNVLSCALDCDDQDALVKAGSKEECNGRDDNCDGAIDEGFLDSDRDGQKDCVDDNDDNDCALDLPDNCDTTPNCESYQAILDRGGKPQCKNPCDIGEWPGFDDVMMCAMERTIKNDPRCRYDGCPWELLGMEGEWFSSRPDLGNAQFASFSSFSTPSFSACSALSNQTANIGNVVSDIRKNCLARERSSPAYAECLRDSDGNGVGDVCQ